MTSHKGPFMYASCVMPLERFPSFAGGEGYAARELRPLAMSGSGSQADLFYLDQLARTTLFVLSSLSLVAVKVFILP